MQNLGYYQLQVNFVANIFIVLLKANPGVWRVSLEPVFFFKFFILLMLSESYLFISFNDF